ncbi:MAG: glycogen-binding domain-containing protein, partial [Spirochaetales bacterium]
EVSRRLDTDFEVSVVDVSDRPEPIPDGPRRTDDGRVEFVYEGTPDQRVHVTGSFNNWDPYMYEMEEVEPGRYETEIRLREGTHFYHFVVDGRRRPDTRNTGNTYTRAGRTVSRFDG